jgi:hypothetical protein
LSSVPTTSVDALPMPSIPTFTVDALPKPKPKVVWVAPRRPAPTATATPAPAATDESADSDNPYDDMKADEAAQ